jgi:hypothetical protein
MMSGEASEVEKIFFVVVGDRGTIAARLLLTFANSSKLNFPTFEILENQNLQILQKWRNANSEKSRKKKLSARDRAKPQRGIKPRRARPRAISTTAVSTTSFVHPAVYRVPACIARLYTPSLCVLLYEEIDLADQLVGRKSVPTRSISYWRWNNEQSFGSARPGEAIEMYKKSGSGRAFAGSG